MAAVFQWLQGTQGIALTWFMGLFIAMGFFRKWTKEADAELSVEAREAIALQLLMLDPQIITFPVLLTTLSTSVWLWLHGLAEFTIKLLSSTVRLVHVLNVEHAPVRAIGTVINVYVLVLGCIGFLGYLLIA